MRSSNLSSIARWLNVSKSSTAAATITQGLREQLYLDMYLYLYLDMYLYLYLFRYLDPSLYLSLYPSLDLDLSLGSLQAERH